MKSYAEMSEIERARWANVERVRRAHDIVEYGFSEALHFARDRATEIGATNEEADKEVISASRRARGLK